MTANQFRRPSGVVPLLAGLLILSQSGCTTDFYSTFDEEPGLGALGEAHFGSMDLDEDGLLSWPEIATSYEVMIERAGWSESDALERFDEDVDGYFNEDEYNDFSASLIERLNDANDPSR